MKFRSAMAAVAAAALLPNAALAGKYIPPDDNTMEIALVVLLGAVILTSGGLGAAEPVTEVPPGE